MALPPKILAQDLVLTFPQFAVFGSTQDAILKQLDPETNQEMSSFVSWLQSNTTAASDAANALSPTGQPGTEPCPLAGSLVQALRPLLVWTSNYVLDKAEFKGICWTQQQGNSPGAEAVQPADGNWKLSTLNPRAGIEFPLIDFSTGPPDSLSLSLVNDQPRHLSVYAQFCKSGEIVAPSDWTSKLPAGVPANFETDTLKYLDVLSPNAQVSALSVPTSPQVVEVPFPGNADSVRMLFGGLGIEGFQAVPDAAGVVLTFVLDFAVPWIVLTSQIPAKELSKWFNELLSDQDMIGKVIAGGEFIITDTNITNVSTLLDALSEKLTGLMLGTPLKGLRDSVNKKLDQYKSNPNGWVEQFAPALGWSAQMIKSIFEGGPYPQYWASRTPATVTLELSASTTIQLDVQITPDPLTGGWPLQATRWEASIEYASGFTQEQAGKLSQDGANPSIPVNFGSVRNKGEIEVSVTLNDDSSRTWAKGQTQVKSSPHRSDRAVQATVELVDTPRIIGSDTQYTRFRTIVYQDRQYRWATSGGQSDSVPMRPPAVGVRQLTGWVGISLEPSARSLGYVWRASSQGVKSCAGGGVVEDAYFMQNLGTIDPGSKLKTINCAFAGAPLLGYPGDGSIRGSGETAAFYLDPRGKEPHLREVALTAGPFKLSGNKSRGRFPAQSDLTSLSIHPAGYAAAVNKDNNTLQIVELAPTAVEDSGAPLALTYAGNGTRAGLLSAPVAVATSPDGLFFVLEEGNKRVQAFDLLGNPVPLFQASPYFPLATASQPVYCDLAVSQSGIIYVLLNENGGKIASDYLLELYQADGTFLSRTKSFNAAKITVDPEGTVYTLDFAPITGTDRTEPSISAWIPSS